MPQTLENGWVQSVWPLTIFSRAEGVSVLGVKSRRGNWRGVIDFSQALDLYVVCLRTVLSFTLNVTYWSTTRWHGHFGHTKKYSHSGLWHSSLPAWWDRHSAAYLINEKADTAQKCRPNTYFQSRVHESVPILYTSGEITFATFGIFTLELLMSQTITTTSVSKNDVNIWEKKQNNNNSVSMHVSTSASMCVITVLACWIIQRLPSANTDINWGGTIKNPRGEHDTAFSSAAVPPHFPGVTPSASSQH